MIGILQRLDFGSGGWKLICPNGDQYELVGNIPSDLEGKKVKVIGSQEESFGFLMSGLPQINVRSISAI